jgi:hypothetical protein
MASRQYCYFDSEFTRISNPRLRTVSAAVLFLEKVSSWWTDDIKGYAEARSFFMTLPKDTVIVCFSVESEARFLISIGIDPRQFKWQCLYLEYLMLMNHNHEIAYGRHLINGQVKRLRPYVDEKAKASLVSALWKFCEIIVDSEHKNAMRDLIISDPKEFTPEQKKDILKYNESDIIYLPKLQRAIADYIMKKLPKEHQKTWFEESLRRADYAVETAWMVSHGYPINVEWAKNLTDNVEPLLDDCIRDINSQFPGEYVPFSFDKSKFRWKANQANWRKWIRDNNLDRDWPLTEGGKSGIQNLSLALEAWADRFDFKHSYPRGNYGAQIVRYLKLKQSLNGFREKAGKDKKSFWEYVGEDGRVRPYFNIYGAQSARTQPSATGFIFLKPAWQRTVVHPPKGKMIVGIDYVSEEVLLAALEGNDDALLEDYAKGDIYLAYGQRIGVIPPNGTKKTHKKERDDQKPVILGWQFGMTGHGLSKNLTQQTGRVWDVDEAQEKIDQLDETYWKFSNYRQEVVSRYETHRMLKLKDGWILWGDNHNHRSCQNFGIQGAGSDIMRRSVIEATRTYKLKVIKTLHDAVYIECDLGDWESVDNFFKAMKEGFVSYYRGTPQEKNAELIRMDGYAWGDDLEDGEITTPDGHVLATMPLYIDERATEEFEQFKGFFMENSGVDAL